MSIKKLARLYGVIFILLGLLGFVPGFTTDGMLLGIFHVNDTLNWINLGAGVISYGMSFIGTRASQIFLQAFGIIYGTIAILGFGYGNADILGWIANNTANTWFHLAAALIALYLGFLYRSAKK